MSKVPTFSFADISHLYSFYRQLRLTLLGWLEQKPRQKNGVWHHAREVDDDGMEQTANIFLSSIFLSSNGFAGNCFAF
jgi:hypothetical protein